MAFSMMICKNRIDNLFNASFDYVICEEDISLVKALFIEAIEDNKENLSIFIDKLDEVKQLAENDLNFFMDSDPAAKSIEEIKLAYPGFKAITIYRISHILFNLGYKVHARIFSEIGHSLTGIDIHPAAEIGCPFFIDHGTGIVIGETSIIGERVKMYQSVTLGALSLSHASELRGVKRHPTIGNDVTIYAGASLLGDIKIGDNVTIGSNVFLTEDVPSNRRVTIGKPELVYKNK